MLDWAVCLLLGGLRDVVETIRFGFSWLLAVSLRKPPIMRVGFPWISSSESRLINGLRGINRSKFFLDLLSEAPEREHAVEAMRKLRILHGQV